MLSKKHNKMRHSSQNMEIFPDISLMGNIYIPEKKRKIPTTSSTRQEE